MDSPEADRPPGVAVVLSTCDRPGRVVNAVRSVLANDYPDFRLLVIDQSEGKETAEVLSRFESDPRFQRIESHRRGLAAGRNLGVRRSTEPVLAFTDDDCEADCGWIGALVRAFARDGRVGIVYGSVRATGYDPEAGFIVSYEPKGIRVENHISGKARIEGIGGCLGVRRSTWEALAGFDEMLGVGAPLRSGEETDLTVRALLAGIAVCETPEPVVTHHGFHRWSTYGSVVSNYMFGLGAVNAKMLRLGRSEALEPLWQLAWRWAAGRPAADLGRVPSRSLRLKAFAQGWRAAMRLQLARETDHFMEGGFTK